ncbi:MAG: isochorismatase, partial [Dehalococcoidia bacterium]|nr:isochorismatase [Dehalococcoidia bacterium]
LPPHFDPSRVGEVWHVPYLELASAAESWARDHDIRPAANDKTRIALVLVDTQITFCIPSFELFVAGRSGNGAVEDNERLCRFIYENLGSITEISATMDTHTALQIFHPYFWTDDAGEHPAPHTEISLADIESGRWRPNPAVAPAVTGGDASALEGHALHYARRLDASGKYPLVVWPYHGMLGGIGHALVPAIEAACFFHAIARASQTAFEVKGGNPLTESYSVLGPEVRDRADGAPLADKNQAFIQRLLSFDAVIIAGQAKSHCVAWTVGDLLDEMASDDPGLAEKVYLLEDCASPVVVPDVADFTEQADAAFRRFSDAGMHVVRSTTPLRDWPDIER